MTEPELPKEALEDPFRPPEEPCMVRCLHCGQEYLSSQIVWCDGFWSCPVEGCGGAGYQFDIHPLDSSLWGDDEEDDDEDFDEDDDEEDEPLFGASPSNN